MRPRTRTRRAVRYVNQLPEPVEKLIVRLKADKPRWDARMIHELVLRRLRGEERIPATSTVHAVFDRHRLVKRARQWRLGKVRQWRTPNTHSLFSKLSP